MKKNTITNFSNFALAVTMLMFFFLCGCGDSDNNDKTYANITLEMNMGSMVTDINLGELGPLPEKGYCNLEIETSDLTGTSVEILSSEFVEDESYDCLAFNIDLNIGSAATEIPFEVCEELEDGASYKFILESESLAQGENEVEVVKL